MAVVAYQAIAITGTQLTYSTVNSTDSYAPNPHGFIHVKNASGGSVTATVVVPGTQYGQARPDVAVAIPAGQDRFIGAMHADLVNPSTGLIDVQYSATTSITAAAVTF